MRSIFLNLFSYLSVCLFVHKQSQFLSLRSFFPFGLRLYPEMIGQHSLQHFAIAATVEQRTHWPLLRKQEKERERKKVRYDSALTFDLPTHCRMTGDSLCTFKGRRCPAGLASMTCWVTGRPLGCSRVSIRWAM